MKKFAIFSLFISIQSVVYSQSINYKIVRDQPYLSEKFRVGFNLVNVDRIYKNYLLSFGVYAKYNHNNQIYINAETSPIVYFDDITQAKIWDEDDLITGLKRYKYNEIGVDYVFHKKAKKKSNADVTLESHSQSYQSTNKTTTVIDRTFLVTECHSGRIYTIRSGLINYRMPIINRGYYGDPDTTYMIKSNVFYVGLAKYQMRNIAIETEEYGTSSQKMRFSMYADLLYSVGMKNHYVLGSNGVSKVNDFSKLGFRTGIQYDVFFADNVCIISNKIEMGVMQSAFFYRICAAFYIDFMRDKKIPEIYKP